MRHRLLRKPPQESLVQPRVHCIMGFAKRALDLRNGRLITSGRF